MQERTYCNEIASRAYEKRNNVADVSAFDAELVGAVVLSQPSEQLNSSAHSSQ